MMKSTQALITFSTRPAGAMLYQQRCSRQVTIGDEALRTLFFGLIWLEAMAIVLGDYAGSVVTTFDLWRSIWDNWRIIGFIGLVGVRYVWAEI